MEHITYKNHTIKYMAVSGNTHVLHFGRYLRGFFNKGKGEGEHLAKRYIDILIKKGA